jgi:hypothetical protein
MLEVPQILVAARDGLHTFDERGQEIRRQVDRGDFDPQPRKSSNSRTDFRLRALVVTGAATRIGRLTNRGRGVVRPILNP